MGISFREDEFRGTLGDFNKQIPGLVTEMTTLEPLKGGTVEQSEPYALAGLPSWILTMKGGSTKEVQHYRMTYLFVFNAAAKRVLTVSFGNDTSQPQLYDYLGNAQKILDSARRESAGP